ncbi:MAG: hypothetical protein ABI165_04245, partial [Bryobacteraceae bacterium]
YNPGQPYNPNQPYSPNQTNNPGEGYNPAQTGQPYNPAQQYNPNQTYNPNQGYNPVQTGQPYNPAQPNNPAGQQFTNPGQQFTPGAPPFIPGRVAPLPQYPGAPVNSQSGGAPQPFPSGAQPGTVVSSIPGTGPGQNPALGLINQLLTTPRQPPSNVTGAGGPGLEVAGGIAGVASKDTDVGIMRYKDRSKYSEWEFVYDFKNDRTLGAVGTAGGMPGGMPGGMQPGAPGGQLGGQSGLGGTSTTQSSTTSSFGGSTFGGSTATPAPSGTGTPPSQ